MTGFSTEPLLVLNAMARELTGFAYRYSNEVQLHERMAQVLTDAGYAFERERQYDPRNRFDFWVGGIVIEVKVAGGGIGDALRQVDRYIGLTEVRGVLLASTESWARRPLKKRPTWGGKPFAMSYLRRQSL